MTFTKDSKILTKKIISGIIILILIPLFAIRVGWWLIELLINYQGAKKELEFLTPH